MYETRNNPKTWPHDERDFIAINPKKKKFLLVSLGFAVVAAMLGDGCAEVLLRQAGRAEDRPVMAIAAARGNRDASLWLARNFHKTEGYRIDALASQHYPPAVYLEAIRELRRDPLEANRLIDEAAGAGDIAAIRYRMHHPAPAEAK